MEYLTNIFNMLWLIARIIWSFLLAGLGLSILLAPLFRHREE